MPPSANEMPRAKLSEGNAIMAFYGSNGYAGPFTAFKRSELERMGIIPLIVSLGGTRSWARNRHLDIPAIATICRNERVISCVRALLGPDLLLWRSNIFAIGDIGLPWHQDEYRTLLNCPPGAAQCSVQINFTNSTKLNTVTVIPATHRWTDDELRQRGYEMRAGSDGGTYGTPRWRIPAGTQTLDMPMKAGQFYVFHPRLLHASVLRRRVRGEARERSWSSHPDEGLPTASEKRFRKDLRYSMALRIATPDTEVLPAAFAESPARATPVLLAGIDTTGINRLGTWAV
jgi:chlorinating enzyme